MLELEIIYSVNKCYGERLLGVEETNSIKFNVLISFIYTGLETNLSM